MISYLIISDSFKDWPTATAALNNLGEKITIVSDFAHKNNEFQEVANNIFSNIFYDESNLALVLHCLKIYHNHSFE